MYYLCFCYQDGGWKERFCCSHCKICCLNAETKRTAAVHKDRVKTLGCEGEPGQGGGERWWWWMVDGPMLNVVPASFPSNLWAGKQTNKKIHFSLTPINILGTVHNNMKKNLTTPLRPRGLGDDLERTLSTTIPPRGFSLQLFQCSLKEAQVLLNYDKSVGKGAFNIKPVHHYHILY